MKKIMFGMALCILLSVISCNSFEVTEAGKKVEIITKEEAPKGTKFIADVENKIIAPTCASNMNEAKNELRNQAAAAGANLVVIDVLVLKGRCYVGSGRAYLK